MARKPTISILALLVIVAPATWGFGKGTGGKSLLRDGFVLMGVNGTLTAQNSNENSQVSPDRWFFEFESEVTDGRGRVKTGARLELLPSAALEKMTANAKERSSVTYRLWARVTKYKGKNFIFPTYFLLLSQTSELQSPKLQEPQQQERQPIESPSVKEDKLEPAVNEPNDVLAIPQEIIEKLKSRGITHTEKFEEPPSTVKPVGDDSHPAKKHRVEPVSRKRTELKQDSILADRIGFIRDWGQEVSFVLDALGRNVPSASGGFGLLPCEVLEQAEQKRSDEVEPLRFKVAGIVTKYKGRHYLLLQKATRVYSYENFGR